jgi:hypothetical protein
VSRVVEVGIVRDHRAIGRLMAGAMLTAPGNLRSQREIDRGSP